MTDPIIIIIYVFNVFNQFREQRAAVSASLKAEALAVSNEFSLVAKIILKNRLEATGTPTRMSASVIAFLNFLNDKNEPIEDSLDGDAPPLSEEDQRALQYDYSKPFMKNLKTCSSTPEGVGEIIVAGLPDLLIRLLIEIPLVAMEQSPSGQPPPFSPRTSQNLEVSAVQTISDILSAICRDQRVVDLVRPHLKTLFESCSQNYPEHLEILRTAMLSCLRNIFQNASSSLIWFIHEQKLLSNVVTDLWELTGPNVEMNLQGNVFTLPLSFVSITLLTN
jgi:hypothetical protein